MRLVRSGGGDGDGGALGLGDLDGATARVLEDGWLVFYKTVRCGGRICWSYRELGSMKVGVGLEGGGGG